MTRTTKIKAICLIALLLAALWATVGCKSEHLGVVMPAPTSDSIASAEANRVSAMDDITAAKPHSLPTGHGHLDRATGNLTTQGEALERARADNLSNVKLYNKAAKEREDALRALTTEQSKFFSHKQRLWFAWIIGISLATWAGLGIASIFLPVGAARRILSLIPFANVFSYFKRKMPPGQ